jgi:hypothetical protein
VFKKLWPQRPSTPPPGAVDLNTYRRYRQAGTDLNHKIVESQVNDAALTYGAETLGLGRKRRLVLETEDDISVLMDYLFYEYWVNGQSLVERYRETVGGQTPVEQELLAAMSGATTSLFRIESVEPRARVLHLTDLLNAGQALTLMDINFSQTAQPGILLFIRPIRLPRFNMTSGFAFVFNGEEEERLIKLAQHPHRRGATPPASARRYETLFKQSRRRGIQVRYET